MVPAALDVGQVATIAGLLNANGGIIADAGDNGGFSFKVEDDTGITTINGELRPNGGINVDNGVFTVEDETGVANIVVWPKVFEEFRRVVLTSRLIGIEGKLQREGLVIHVIAEKAVDLSHLLNDLGQEDGNWDRAIANADEVKRAVTGDQRLMRLRSRDFH